MLGAVFWGTHGGDFQQVPPVYTAVASLTNTDCLYDQMVLRKGLLVMTCVSGNRGGQVKRRGHATPVAKQVTAREPYRGSMQLPAQ